MFDSACANAVRSLAELYYLWYVLATLVCCSLAIVVGLLRLFTKKIVITN